MKLFIAMLLVCCNALAGANYAEVPLRVPAPNVILYVPWETPTDQCQLVAPWPGTSKPRAVTLVHNTFVENFDVMPLLATSAGEVGRWAPHLDGGFVNGRFQGYEWRDKRYQPGAKEEQLYVDPAYRGTGKTALGLNPFSITDSVLTITADYAKMEAQPLIYNHVITSGLISSHQMAGFVYGFFEISAKIPKGEKLLPAFWLRDDRTWPARELDIIEMPGHEPLTGSYASHWKSPVTGKHASSGCKVPMGYDDGRFHTFGLLWTAERVVWYFDRQAYAQMKTQPGQSDIMYLTANLAVGGTWVGFTTAATPIPQKMEIDYIAAWSTAGSKGCEKDARGVLICR